MTPSAFLSYCWERAEDIESIGRIEKHVRLRGLSVFRDLRSLSDGDDLAAEIEAALAVASVFAPYLTPESIASDPVVDLEFLPAVRLKRDTGAPTIVATARGLGESHTDLRKRTWSRLGYPFDARWTKIVLEGDEALSDEDAREAACRILGAAVAQLTLDGDEALPMQIVTRGDRPAARGFVVDATEQLGGSPPRPGDVEDWEAFASALRDLAQALTGAGCARPLEIECRCHLTAAVAAGFAFRAASGWDIAVRADDGALCLRSARRTHPDLKTHVEHGPLTASGLSVEIGLLPQPIDDAVERTLRDGDPPRRRLIISRPDCSERMPSSELGAMAGAIADTIKAQAQGCGHVDLFIAAPAAFAVLLGHELNGLARELRLHEFVGDRYLQTLRLET